MTNGQKFLLGFTVVGLIAVLTLSTNVIENLDADEVMVIQSPLSGDLNWYTDPGVKMQWFGKVTNYPRRSNYDFEFQMRFNDGGHGTMKGSIQYEVPLDHENLTALHKKFGSPDAIRKQLIETVTNKAIYMTGPLMSSKESYAERRNDLIKFVEDQIQNGVYRTLQKNVRVVDPITGQEKSSTIVEIVMGSNGHPERQEEAVLTQFGIRTFNFSISSLDYEAAVEAQIKAQQQLAMDVQTAMAESKKAEQRAITIAKQGEAEAAKAKWDQEVKKAQAVTEAQQQYEVAQTQAKQRVDVARLDADAAEQYKRAQLLRAEADATYKQKVMEADGALAQKLEALKEINRMYADAIKEHQGPWVPSVVMGAGANSNANGAMPLIDLLTARTAQQLAIDMTIQGQQKPQDGPRK